MENTNAVWEKSNAIWKNTNAVWNNTNAVLNCSYKSSAKKNAVATNNELQNRKLDTKVARVAAKKYISFQITLLAAFNV